MIWDNVGLNRAWKTGTLAFFMDSIFFILYLFLMSNHLKFHG